MNSDQKKEYMAVYNRQYYAAHKERLKKDTAAYATKDVERTRRYKREFARRARFKQYGITDEQHAAMVYDQDGMCAICGEVPEKGLCVDHCHTSGNVRALLCHKCNVRLAPLEDSDWAAKAFAYLERFR